jgi:lipopolysaccharide export system protein LptA
MRTNPLILLSSIALTGLIFVGAGQQAFAAERKHAKAASKVTVVKSTDKPLPEAKKDTTLKGLSSPDFNKLPTYVKSDSLALKQVERYFIYSGNVEAKHGDLTITSQTLEGNYDQNNKIQKLTAKTNVLITKGDTIRGTSEIAVYDAATDTVTMTENPELTQNGSVLTADAIKVFMKENRSEASGQVRVKMIDKKLGEKPITK